jgi:hypothetical protein
VTVLTMIPEVDGKRLLIGCNGNHIEAETQFKIGE